MFGKSSRETESSIGAEKESAGASPTIDGSRQGGTAGEFVWCRLCRFSFSPC